MVETIQTLKMYSSILLVSALVMALLSIFVAWRYNLLDYYRIKRGKLRKSKQPVIVDKKVSQYYSEVLSSDDDSHEIVNEGFFEDDSVDLQNKIKLGEFSDGVVNQIIDDDAEPMLSMPSGRDYLGEDETNLLGHPTHSDDGVEETMVLNATDSFSGEEETSLLTYDSVLDETAVTVIGAPGVSKGRSTIGSIYDETAVVELTPDEGAEETTVLNASSSEKDDSLVDFVDETEVVELAPEASSVNSLIYPQENIVNFADEEEMPTEELSSFVSNREQSDLSQNDYEGDEETSVLTAEDSIQIQPELNNNAPIISDSKEAAQPTPLEASEMVKVVDVETQLAASSSKGDAEQKDEVSHSLWGAQTSIFAEDDDGILVEHSNR